MSMIKDSTISQVTSKVQVSGLSIYKQKKNFAYKRENYYELCIRRLHKGVIHAGIKPLFYEVSIQYTTFHINDTMNQCQSRVQTFSVSICFIDKYNTRVKILFNISSFAYDHLTI